MESSPFVSLSDCESVIDFECDTAGNVVPANTAAPPISMSRRVNLAILPPPLVPDLRSLAIRFRVWRATRFVTTPGTTALGLNFPTGHPRRDAFTWNVEMDAGESMGDDFLSKTNAFAASRLN